MKEKQEIINEKNKLMGDYENLKKSILIFKNSLIRFTK